MITIVIIISGAPREAADGRRLDGPGRAPARAQGVREGGDDAVGNPHRARVARFELFELIVLLNLDNSCLSNKFEPMVCNPLLQGGRERAEGGAERAGGSHAAQGGEDVRQPEHQCEG